MSNPANYEATAPSGGRTRSRDLSRDLATPDPNRAARAAELAEKRARIAVLTTQTEDDAAKLRKSQQSRTKVANALRAGGQEPDADMLPALYEPDPAVAMELHGLLYEAAALETSLS